LLDRLERICKTPAVLDAERALTREVFMRRNVAVFMLLAVFVIAPKVQASTIAYDFAGSITSSNPAPGPTTFTGSLSYDSPQTNQCPGDIFGAGCYDFSNLSVTIGTDTISGSGALSVSVLVDTVTFGVSPISGTWATLPVTSFSLTFSYPSLPNNDLPSSLAGYTSATFSLTTDPDATICGTSSPPFNFPNTCNASGALTSLAVPEPTTALLLACGLVGLGVLLRVLAGD